MIDIIPGTKVHYKKRHLMTSAFFTLRKGQGHTTRSNVTDVEVSAFTECFLFFHIFFYISKQKRLFRLVIQFHWLFIRQCVRKCQPIFVWQKYNYFSFVYYVQHLFCLSLATRKNAISWHMYITHRWCLYILLYSHITRTHHTISRSLQIIIKGWCWSYHIVLGGQIA